ncbi:ribonuclease HII [Advenella sp. RU8]|uniref:ribonuclease HII n=1 Tax=Advenella sp. RU8 TaxID=3399575 RepID=UPI003AADE202
MNDNLDLFESPHSGLLVAGIDEAGRGPLAGSVYAAAVILDPLKPIGGLMDSKKLSEKKRDQLALEIRENALSWSIACANVEEIDSINILQATMLAMKRAFLGLSITPGLVLIDGNRVPADMSVACRAIIKGDALEPCISAASILAKTARDASLKELHEQYPEYGFDQHKGYGTALHLERLRLHGACPAHRRSFAPVRKTLA